MKFPPSSRNAPAVGYALAMLLLLLVGVLSFVSLGGLLASEAWVVHTQRVMFRLENVLSLLKDAETGQRGYLLTGDTAFLQPLRNARPRVLASQQALALLTSDNPAQQRRLDTLRTLAAQKQALVAALVAGYRPDQPTPVARLRQGKAVMDQLRGLVSRLQSAELALLAQRQARVQRSGRVTPRLVAGLTGLALLFGALAGWGLQRQKRLLADSRNRFAQLLETIPPMAWTSQPDGTVDYLSAQWSAYTGASPAQLAASGPCPYLHPDDVAPSRAAWQQALRTGAPLAELHNRWKRGRDNEYRWHLAHAVPLHDAHGRVVLWVGTTTDVHAQQLQQQNLERVNADLDTFVYTASHDLKQPINNIEGLLVALREDLAQDPAAPEIPQLLALMQGSVDRFKRTIAHLTDVARLQRADEQPTVAVDLAALVAAVQLDLAPELAAAAGRLTVDLAACPPLAFAEKNLHSIVYNLLSNAIKYHCPGRAPRVHLRYAATAGHHVLEVQDNGLGLSPGQQLRLFGLFQRLHNHVEGSGIGLYMIKKIVENAGGRIEVESEAGVGSTFRVCLPR